MNVNDKKARDELKYLLIIKKDVDNDEHTFYNTIIALYKYFY